MPHELAIEVLERDVTSELVRARRETEAQRAVEEGAVTPV